MLVLLSVRAALPRTLLSLRRNLHLSLPPPPIPPKTAAVPDVPTFLQKIGRESSGHAPKFTSWENFFAATSQQLKEMGVEPARLRRYIIQWREKYRRANGEVQLKEHKRGRKIDGGERRRKDVRAKRYQKERREAEEARSSGLME